MMHFDTNFKLRSIVPVLLLLCCWVVVGVLALSSDSARPGSDDKG